MITVITGAPGSGKSAALVSLLSDLAKDRAIYVNGIPDLLIPHTALDDVSTWPDSVPDGSIIVIDEVQRVWRPRGPGSKVPADISALETHRHRGLDFYIITQAPRLIDSNVRSLVGRHVHLRDIGLLGRWWYEWPEISESCAASWKNAPIKKRYRLPKAVFGQYKSASVHIKPIRSVPWMVAVMFLALVIVAAMSWKAYTMISGKIAPQSKPDAVQAKGIDSIVNRASPAAVPLMPVGYDTSQFIPRVSNRPESAPAFDHLRIVVAMPQVTGGYCVGEICKCSTDQGTNAGLSSTECRFWMENRPWDPYRMPTVSGAPSGGTVSSASPSARGPSTVESVRVAPSSTAVPSSTAQL